MRNIARREFLQLAAGSAALAPAHSWAAPAWPTRPIRALATGGPGSAVDVISRVVFERLSSQLGQPIVVENRVGAGGTIAVAAVAKADPDGYTVLTNSSALTVAPWFHTRLPYDTVRDVAGVAMFGNLPSVLVAAPARGRMTIAAFVAAARAAPGVFNYTSTGVGSATHMSAERFRVSARIEAVHVPVKSGPEALTEVLSGRSDFYLCPIATALPFINDKRLVGLVVTGQARTPELPGVPTTAEAGFPDADYAYWVGMFMPAKTPRDIVSRLHDETMRAMGAADIRARLASLGVVPAPMTPEQLDAQIRDELAQNGALIRSAGIKPD